jgi:hypothetical protein
MLWTTGGNTWKDNVSFTHHSLSLMFFDRLAWVGWVIPMKLIQTMVVKGRDGD